MPEFEDVVEDLRLLRREGLVRLRRVSLAALGAIAGGAGGPGGPDGPPGSTSAALEAMVRSAVEDRKSVV